MYIKVCCIAVASMILAATSVEAQIQVTPFKIKGKIAGLDKDSINVVTDANERWVVKLKSPYTNLGPAKIQILGTAAIKNLRPNMHVRFSADVDTARKRVEKPLSEVTIFTPNEIYKVGIFPDDNPVDDNGRPVKKRVRACLVAGRIVSVSKKSVRIAAAGVTLSAKFSPDAVVKIDSGDLRGASVGNRIDVSGVYQTKGAGYASHVTIHLPKPAPEKPAPKKRAPNRRAKKPPAPAIAPAPAKGDGGKVAQAKPEAKPPVVDKGRKPRVLIIN